jgi:hypothetical protein
MKIAAMPDGHGGDCFGLLAERSPGHPGRRGLQLRSLRGAGVVALDDELSLEVDDEDDELSVDVAAGAAVELSVEGLFDVSLPCVLDGVADCVLLGIALVSVAAGVAGVEEVDDESVVVCATAKPIPASRAAAAATADNFFW